MGDEHAALERQFLDLAERQRKPVVQPHAVGDDLDGVPLPPVRRRRGRHEQSPRVPDTTSTEIIPRRSANVTTPAGELTDKLAVLGWSADVRTVGGSFIVGTAEPPGNPG